MRHLVAPLLAVPLLALVPAPAHAAGSCQGMPATIESPGGATVTGTEGPDVILVTGPATVAALGGDDTVCVAGGSLDAGPGDDRVSVTGQDGQDALLGQGDDTYVSVGQTDIVDTEDGASAGADNIETGDGNNDEIWSGTAGEANRDVVSTPDGTVHLTLAAGSSAWLTAVFVVDLIASDAASYVIDAPSSTITRDGDPVTSYDSTTEAYEFSGRRGRFTFHGADVGEFVAVRSVAGFKAGLGGGGDNVYLYPGVPRTGRIDGGPGNNSLNAHAKDSAVGDLARRRLTLTSDGRRSTWRVSRFASVRVAGRRIDLRGSSARDLVVAFGCDITLRGRGGNDVLAAGTFERGWPPARRCPGGERGQRAHLYGGAGKDYLEGGKGPDVLIGGTGKDDAYGRGGRDRCEAEMRSTC